MKRTFAVLLLPYANSGPQFFSVWKSSKSIFPDLCPNRNEKDIERIKQLNRNRCLNQYQKFKEIRKEKQREYNKIKIICDCGVQITNASKSKHIKSKKHLSLIS